MTKLLEQAIEAARALPPDMQDDIARVVFHLAGNEEPPVVLSDEVRDQRTTLQIQAIATNHETLAIQQEFGRSLTRKTVGSGSECATRRR